MAAVVASNGIADMQAAICAAFVEVIEAPIMIIDAGAKSAAGTQETSACRVQHVDRLDIRQGADLAIDHLLQLGEPPGGTAERLGLFAHADDDCIRRQDGVVSFLSE